MLKKLNRQISSIGRELIRTVAGDYLGDVIFDVAEVFLDQNLSDGVLKDLPVVGVLAKLAKSKQSVSEELFIRKLVRFLYDLNNLSSQEKEKFIEKYPDFSEEQRVLGENLLLALERLDDIEKPAILARFFAAYIKAEIDYLTFTRLPLCLGKFNLGLLPSLRGFYTGEESAVKTSEEIIHELSLSGLIRVGLAGSGAIGGSARYLQSNIGKLFLSIGFDAVESAA